MPTDPFRKGLSAIWEQGRPFSDERQCVGRTAWAHESNLRVGWCANLRDHALGYCRIVLIKEAASRTEETSQHCRAVIDAESRTVSSVFAKHQWDMDFILLGKFGIINSKMSSSVLSIICQFLLPEGLKCLQTTGKKFRTVQLRYRSKFAALTRDLCRWRWRLRFEIWDLEFSGWLGPMSPTSAPHGTYMMSSHSLFISRDAAFFCSISIHLQGLELWSI